MNDSFLEDLELVQAEPRPEAATRKPDRNITRRRSQPSPLPTCSEGDTPDVALRGTRAKQDAASSLAISSRPLRAKSGTRENRPAAGENVLKPEANWKKLETKERPRWSGGSSKETSRVSDASSKENSRPLESSRESVVRSESGNKERGGGDAQRRKKDETFEVAVLNSVKEIVGTYTKNESTKILRAMQEIYINSQANLIKLMLQREGEIERESSSAKDSDEARTLVRENAELRENLRRALEENEAVKKENVKLKSRCKELLKSGATGGSKENSRPTAAPSKNSPATGQRSGKLSELSRNSK